MNSLPGNNNPEKLMPGGLSAFTVNIIFVVLVIAGLSLAPLVSFMFMPTRSLPSITVSYNWPNVSGRVIEMEVTGPLEGAFSTVRGVTQISSQSSRGRGWVEMEFDKATDMDAVRFEVASLIRRVYPNLPDGVSRPEVRLNRPGDDERAIMTYTVNANATTYSIGRYAEDVVKRQLSDIPGVYEVRVTGTRPFEWVLKYDSERLHSLGLDQNSLQGAIQEYLSAREMGQVLESRTEEREERINLLFRGNPQNNFTWENIPVTVSGNRIIYLTEVARPAYVEQQPVSYYRINGLNTVNISIYAERGANHLSVANEIKSRVNGIRGEMPEGFSIILANDTTDHLRSELRKNAFRTSFSLVALLIFVYLVSLQRRYLFIVAISLISNIVIGFMFYFLLGVEIHFYSLAGITVSLGIIIDNTIVMIEHVRYKKNLKVFLALLAATLTTIGALSVIFFLDESQRVNLVDFSRVVMINLSVCLLIALFFVPAMMEKWPLKIKRSSRMMRRKRRIAGFTQFYRRYIIFGKRWKKAFFVAGILAFGTPIFWLPEEVEGEKWYHNLYNSTVGSDTYTRTIRPVTDKALGGTLRLFAYHVTERSFFTEPERTRLFVRAYLPEGSTIEHANTIMEDFENFLAGFEEVEQYHTRITSPEFGRITIYIEPEHENTVFPYRLKSQLEYKAIYSGGGDFVIGGVGRAFSNRFSQRTGNPSIIITGYNYEMLTRYATDVSRELEEHPRIQRVYMSSSRNVYSANVRTEYLMDFDRERLTGLGYSIGDVYSYLTGIFIHESTPFRINIDGEQESVRLRSENAADMDLWEVRNTLLGGHGGQAFKMKEVGDIQRTIMPDHIYKLNQQYTITLTYSFAGPSQLASRVRDRYIDDLNEKLPMGFTADDAWGRWMWRADDSRQYVLLFLVIAIIFFICAILLESLLQPLAVILMLPLSYIGIFLTFYLFDFNFDQGGYAAFLFLSGIVVNSALYILNDMNNLKKSNPGLNIIEVYLKGYNAKIIPIILTVASTILGLTPFLLGGAAESFWFALAVGTIGGLLFSMLMLIVFLPLMVRGTPKNENMLLGQNVENNNTEIF